MINRISVTKEVLELANSLFDDHSEELNHYIDLLFEWNEKMNLVSRSVSRETVREHVVHSLIPASLGLLNKHDKWIDSGTGGGLPGIPLAIVLKEFEWRLNDNVRKKMRAVSSMIDSLGLTNAEAVAKSISLVEMEKGTGIVTKHAFKLDDLLRLLGGKPWKTIIMWKGVEDAEKEIQRAKKKLNYTLYDFKFTGNSDFYEGKGILKIER